MEIVFKILDEDFSETEKSLISACLAVQSNDDLISALEKIAKSALMEYIKMLIGEGMPSRASEVQQERLFYLLIYYFQDRIPSENELSYLFQLTQSQSKMLLKNTKSRYRTKIYSHLVNTYLKILRSVNYNEDMDKYEFVCISPSIIDDLNFIISQKGPTQEAIKKIPGFISLYSCSKDTYNLIINELNG